ncbi:hypothetical protein Poli38472_008116 [Pythium oligandrum]|uniref:Uncharacterized protein n=1 Tax=Pythium oligandrum TaxID=41045 RepID=A0A8K1FLP8_PYTOL|nr:hypothetical protein Poli38472_008116 [Pythium oligandrum]|eukprot:TMW65474.1 hypothetical protein Poli38472_008116 [Pythium oligandrum]
MVDCKVFIVTGGTSGIGLECCRELAKLSNVHVIVAGRDKQHVNEAVTDIKKTAAVGTEVEGMIVDVASLKSVRNFADAMLQRNLQFFALVCNAGIQVTKETVDGFESTIGTNYVGHFLLVKLLRDRVKCVITVSSRTHDPAARTDMPSPNLSNSDQLAKVYDDFNPKETYTTSKLCNLLHAKELAHRGTEAIAYSPGFTPGTGLARELPKLVVTVAMFVVRIITRLRGQRVSTPTYSGAFMASIAAMDSLETKGWRSGDYFDIDRVVSASEQARDSALSKALWDKSEEWQSLHRHGGTSGIGLECCRELAKLPNVLVIVAGRNKQRVDDAVAEVKKTAAQDTIVGRGIVDVSSLKSVRNFADDMLQRGLQIFALVCNAGIQVTKTDATVDGFESTIGTNHIGHFLLVQLLRDRVKRVFTVSSETHDPAEKTGMAAPDISNLDQLAKGYDKFDPRVAYSTSKLCNVLHVKEMARRSQNGPQAIAVPNVSDLEQMARGELVRRFPEGPVRIAYSPGFTPGTGLAREPPSALVSVAISIARIIHWIRGERVSTPEYSGAYQASLAAADSLEAKGWHSGDYISIDRVIDASDQARDPVLGKALWSRSEEWVRPFVN